MTRTLAIAYAASLLAHAGAGVALVRWQGPTDSPHSGPLAPDAPIELAVRFDVDSPAPSGTLSASPAADAFPPAPARDARSTPAEAIRAEDIPSASIPVSPEIVTPLFSALPTLEPISASPVPLELVASRLPTISPLPAGTAATGSAPAVESTATGEGGSAVLGRGRLAAYRRNPPPDYPGEALARGWEGIVLLSVVVGPDGRANSLVVAGSSGHASLDEAAVAAVRRWEFQPARLDDRPIPTKVEVPVRFYLTARRTL